MTEILYFYFLRSDHAIRDGNPLNTFFHGFDHFVWNGVTIVKYIIIAAIAITLFNFLRNKIEQQNIDAISAKEKKDKDLVERLEKKYLDD